MTALTPAMDAALSADRLLLFGALEVTGLPGGASFRVVDGAAELNWGRGVFKGRDDTFGALAAIDMPEDGFGDQAPNMSITMIPPTTAAAVTLAAPTMQGALVSLWLGAVNPDTGGVVADPYLLFFGELDQPTLSVDDAGRTVELECVGAFERFFENEEGQRLSRAFHQSVWPGETGLDAVTGVTRTVLWGPGDRPPSVSNPYGAGGYSGGGVTAGGMAGGYMARFADGGRLNSV